MICNLHEGSGITVEYHVMVCPICEGVALGNIKETDGEGLRILNSNTLISRGMTKIEGIDQGKTLFKIPIYDPDPFLDIDEELK